MPSKTYKFLKRHLTSSIYVLNTKCRMKILYNSIIGIFIIRKQKQSEKKLNK